MKTSSLNYLYLFGAFVIGLCAQGSVLEAQAPKFPLEPGDTIEAVEEASSSPQHSPSPIDSALEAAKTKRGPLSAFELDVEMSAGTYERNPSPESRDRYILALENFAGPLCMPHLFETLNFEGNPSDSRCLEVLHKIRDLMLANPLVICAQNGIDAPSCADSYRSQKVLPLGTFPPTTTPSPAEELSEKIAASKSESAIMKLAEELNTVAAAQRSQPNEENIEKLKDITKKILALSCRTVRLKLEQSKDPQADAKNSGPDVPLEKAIDALDPGMREVPEAPTEKTRAPTPVPNFRDMDIFALKTAKEKANEPGPDSESRAKYYTRIRLLSQTCLNYIDYSFTLDPNFSAGICNRDGFYSPTCIAALRTARIKNREKQKLATPLPKRRGEKDGLSAF